MSTAAPPERKDDGKTARGNPIPAEFAHAHQLSVTEAVMWLTIGRRVSKDQLRSSEEQLSYVEVAHFSERVEDAQRSVINLIIEGVRAVGTLHEDDHPYHGNRTRVPTAFLKDGAYIELVSGCILPDLLQEKHFAADPVRKYRDVELDRDAFFDAIGPIREQRSEDVKTDSCGLGGTPPKRPGARPGTNEIDDAKAIEKLRSLMEPAYGDPPSLNAASLEVASGLKDAAAPESKARRLRRKYQKIHGRS